MINFTALIILIFLFQNLYGQMPKVKKETIIKTDYYNKIYWNGDPKTDTIITEYDINGATKSEFKNPQQWLVKAIFLDSAKTIKLEKKATHRQEFWSDSTVVDIYGETLKKSISEICVQNNDTFVVREAYFKKKNNVKNFRFEEIEEKLKIFDIFLYYPYKITLNFENMKNATVSIKRGGGYRTFKMSIFTQLKKYKKSIYNYETKEWFVEKKIVERKRKKKIWETFYHDYHKQYFTKTRTLYFNKYNQLIKELEYDFYTILVKQTTYNYEYY